MLALLRRSYIARRMLLARSLSVWGDTFFAMAAMWVTLEVTGSAWRMALVALAEVMPYLLFSAVAGALVDRWDRRRVLVMLDLVQGAVVAAVPVLYMAGWFSPWVLPVVGFVIATCRTLYGPAMSAYYPAIVEKADLPALLGLISVAFRSGAIVVPLLLGAFFARIELVPALLLDAATFLVSALLMRSLPAAPVAARGGAGQAAGGGRPALWREVRAGVGVLTDRRLLLLAIATCALGSVVRAPLYRFALPLLATGELQAGEAGYKLLQMAQGLGGVAGAMLTSWVIKRWGAHVRTTVAGWALSGVGTLLAGLGPLVLGAHGMIPAMAGLVLSSLGTPIAYTATSVSVQTDVPPEHVGKVSGLYQTVDFAGDYGGVLLMPLWLTWFRVESVFAVGALVTLLFCAVAYLRVVRAPAPEVAAA